MTLKSPVTSQSDILCFVNLKSFFFALNFLFFLLDIGSSGAGDLISRRGVFSRSYYGSVERLQQVESQEGQEEPCRRFRIENGESQGEKDEMFGSPSAPVLENPEYQTRWYFKYFLGKLHQNYFGLDNDRAPYFLSVVLNNEDNDSTYRAILFTKTGAQKICLQISQNKTLNVKQILSNFPNMDKVEKGPKEIFSPDIQKDLLLLEEQEGSVNFKFGVIYVKPGQLTDDEFLSNGQFSIFLNLEIHTFKFCSEHGSDKFDQFLNLLGEKIKLKNWDKFRGGLDTKRDMTGHHSIYTIYEGHEIMFHVSTLLPYSRDNRQQLERKRHIGNDIVNIVFLDSDDDVTDWHTQFKPNCIKSQFTHVFAAISMSGNGRYRLSIFSDEAVPLFGPSLPCPPIFDDPNFFREFLLVKLINGEKATFDCPTFSRKRQRTLEMLLKDLYSEHVAESRATMLNRRAFSDVLADTPRHSKLKEDARQIEFVRVGQALKLEAIVRGDAPTSLASAGTASTVFKKSPWEASCFHPVFPYHSILSGDSWGNDRLILATEEGTYVTQEGKTHRQIFDESLQIYQLNVVEPHGIILFRASAPHKEARIYVLRLNQIEVLAEIKSRMDLKEFRMEKTRATHLYAVSGQGGARLRMGVAVGRKLLMFQWKHSAAWTAWCPNSDTDTVEGFIFLWEMNLSDTPTLLNMLENVSKGDIMVCVGYKNHWDLVNGRFGHVQHLYTVEGNKAHLVAALDLYDNSDVQFLLCFNHTCHFQRLTNDSDVSENCSKDFHWNSSPTDIVCVFPYLIAFTSNTMEIRLVINGHLIHTMTMPKLRLIASKNDVYFASTAPEFFSNEKQSPPTSPNLSSSPDGKPLRIYKIPLGRSTPTPMNDNRSNSPLDDPKLTALETNKPFRSANNSPAPLSKARRQQTCPTSDEAL
ncbi:hypothetical protein ABEB36_014213 [Hypothenemus hampei]|uniref:GTPase-activating Rap/Ran-GAP domain-like protein 3 n=1 Tax=Hypothenemus hampei TaxID=57062 RepID=A0ABD1E3P3_HYPHA